VSVATPRFSHQKLWQAENQNLRKQYHSQLEGPPLLTLSLSWVCCPISLSSEEEMVARKA